MSLRPFREGLEASIRTDRAVRPFVCDGSPLHCRAFIVGINAASDVSFWRFWDDETGFDKKRWYDLYRAQRAGVDKKPVSPTRQRIGRIVCAAAPGPILETNLYSVATAKAGDLKENDKRTDAIEFLLREVSPRILLLHGKAVKEHFERLCGHTLTSCFSSATIYGRPVKIAAVRQLAYVSYEGASKLGETIRSLVAE